MISATLAKMIGKMLKKINTKYYYACIIFIIFGTKKSTYNNYENLKEKKRN